MKFIKFDKDQCDECYKCLRVCPTKAIIINKNKREIVDDLCIKCGLCQSVCMHNALEIQNDQSIIKEQLAKGKKIAVSLAPSFASVEKFHDYKKLVTALRLLGFTYIEETSVGAEYIGKYYEQEIKKGTRKNIITSCCPSSNYYIEKYFPNQIDNILPIVSPMIFHGRLMKKKYGKDVYTVFIGPCLAKKAEAEEIEGSIDAVLTFNELLEWLDEESINLEHLPENDFDATGSKRGAAFPLGGSLYNETLNAHPSAKYRYMKVEGIERCKDILETLDEDSLANYCIEMNICDGSCLAGPDLPKENNYYKRELLLNRYVNTYKGVSFNSYDHLIDESKRYFEDQSTEVEMPTHEQMREILNGIGKYTLQDEINCGACGYATCKEKAISVFNGMSDAKMCLPYLKKKAENFQSAIFENSPNLICILDDQLNIKEFNPSFNKSFGGESIELKKFPIYAFIEEEYFVEVIKNKRDLIRKKVHLPDYEKDYYLNIIYLEEESNLVVILTDITLNEQNRVELESMKEKTLMTCQEVIDKQMRVAQEIASLLGETTAETKVNLNKLRDLVISDSGRL